MTFVFVHLPKTAGTSFRYAFEVKYPGRVLFDYRADSPKTSEPIRQLVYGSPAGRRKKAEAVRDFAAESGTMLLCGHFHAKKYWGAFQPERFAVFLREPVGRLLSAYNHRLRLGRIVMPFEEFALGNETNLQSGRLEGVDIEDFGFVGLSERYTESLSAFNRLSGLGLDRFARNRTPLMSRQVRRDDLSPTLVRQIADLNSDDMALYERAIGLFERRNAAVS